MSINWRMFFSEKIYVFKENKVVLKKQLKKNADTCVLRQQKLFKGHTVIIAENAIRILLIENSDFKTHSL